MKKLFLFIVVLMGTMMHGMAISEPSLVIQAIEMVNAPALLAEINRGKITEKELMNYIFLAEKKYDFFKSKLIFWRKIRYFAWAGIPLSTITSMIVGGVGGTYCVGVSSIKKVIPEDTGNFTNDIVWHLSKLGICCLAAGIGGIVGSLTGMGIGAVTSISFLAYVNKKITFLQNQADKAYTNLLILKNVLVNLNKTV